MPEPSGRKRLPDTEQVISSSGRAQRLWAQWRSTADSSAPPSSSGARSPGRPQLPPEPAGVAEKLEIITAAFRFRSPFYTSQEPALCGNHLSGAHNLPGCGSSHSPSTTRCSSNSDGLEACLETAAGAPGARALLDARTSDGRNSTRQLPLHAEDRGLAGTDPQHSPQCRPHTPLLSTPAQPARHRQNVRPRLGQPRAQWAGVPEA